MGEMLNQARKSSISLLADDVRGDFAAPSGRGGNLVAAHTPASRRSQNRRPAGGPYNKVLTENFTGPDSRGTIEKGLLALLDKLNFHSSRNYPMLEALREKATNGLPTALGIVKC